MNKRGDLNFSYSSDHFDNDIFLALFRKGADAYLENDLLIDRTDIDSKSQISDIADKEIENMIKQSIRKEKSKSVKKIAPKILIFASAVFIVFFVTVISVEALRAPFLNLLVNTEERVTDIELNKQQAMMEGESFEEAFGYIPEGFELQSEEIQGQDVSLYFYNENGGRIFIDIDYDGSGIRLDTEGSEYSEIIINDEPGFYSTKDDFTSLIFIRHEYAYTITASIDLLEILEIAENINY